MRKILLITFLIFTYSLSAQSWQWAVKDSGAGNNDGASICVDSSGNSYVTGSLGGSTYFNSCGTVSSPYRNFFIAKYDNSGNCVWLKTAGANPPSGVEGVGIAIDKHHNLLALGKFSDSVSFDAIKLMGVSGNNLFVVKYDNNGNVIWAKGCPGFGRGISVDKFGNVYLTGITSGIGNLGSCVLSNGFLLVKLDSNGNCIWAKGNANQNVIGSGIKTDSIGNSYVAGSYLGAAIFGNDTLPPYSNTQYGIFTAKFDSSGNSKWAKAPWDTGGATFEFPTPMDIDKWGDVFVSGVLGSTYFGCDTLKLNSNSSFIVKLDSSGNCLWDKLVSNATTFALHANRDGNSYLGCTFNSSASIGLCNVSGSGFFIVRLDSAGNCIWTETASGSSIPVGIAIDYNGNCHITGDIIGNTSFGSTTLTNPNGSVSVLVAKLDVPTGIVEVSHSPITFNIYPNPSAGGYNLDISASLLNSQLTIYDTQGRNIFQTKIAQENPVINIPSLAKGMYYVKLITPQGQSTEKTIVQQ